VSADEEDEGEESEYDSEEEREECKQAIIRCFLKRNEPLTSSQLSYTTKFRKDYIE